MKKLFFMTVLLGLMVCCSEQEVMNDATRTKRFAPNQVTGGVDVDPRLDATVLMTETEVVALASSVLGVNESNPEVTWIASEDFYAGYEKVLQLTGTQEEIAQFYDTLQIVPSKCFCVVNYSNASALIRPDKRLLYKFILGHIGKRIDPGWCKWTPLSANIDSDIDDDNVDSLLIWIQETWDLGCPLKEDLVNLKKWQGYLSSRTTICDSELDTVSYTLCTQEQLLGAYDDCDSIASAFTRAFTSGFIGGEIYPGRPIEPMNPLSTEEDGSCTPAEFMKLEYCEIIPYVERHLGFSESKHPLWAITNFLQAHGITATAYTGDNDAVVRQAFSEGKIPLLYKDGDWGFVFRYDEIIEDCGSGSTYMYYISACTPTVCLDINPLIDSGYTVVLLEY